MRPLVLALALMNCATAPAPKSDADLKPWADVTAGFTLHDGAFPVWIRGDGAVLLELSPNHLGHVFGASVVISRGHGVGDLFHGGARDDGRLLEFRRAGRKVIVIERSDQVEVAPGQPSGEGLARPVGETVLAVLPVVSEGENGRFLADPTEWFISDARDVAGLVKNGWSGDPNVPVMQDKARSFVERVRSFPKNLEVDATLTFVPGKTPEFPALMPANPTTISVSLRWSLFSLPEKPLATRIGDERIGYFATSVSNPRAYSASSTVRVVDHIHRWRLEKQNPSAAKSKPVKPITYYLDPSIPAEYRQSVREGVLSWNRAFEAIGFIDAIEVKDAPADFDFLDFQVSSLMWSVSLDFVSFSGYGPHHVDPRTGEILDADITLNANMFASLASVKVMPQRAECGSGASFAPQLALLKAAAATRPGLDTEAVKQAFLKWIVMHEVGHTLGLRHNFRGSANVPVSKLHDAEWTKVNGLSSSVMDYAPTNIAPAGQTQGEFYQSVVGTYDVLAVKYGYADNVMPAQLEAIGTEATKAGLLFGTDDDNWAMEWAVDARIAGGDLGDDPLQWARNRITLINEALPTAAEAVVNPGESWSEARPVVDTLLSNRTYTLTNALRLVGGLELRKAHKGDGVVPLTPYPVDQQRQALQFVLSEGLGDGFTRGLTPELLGQLSVPRMATLGWGSTELPMDAPVHEMVARQQTRLVNEVLASARLQRIIDNSVRMPGGGPALPLVEVFTGVTRATFSELDAPKPVVTTWRRAVQRAVVQRYLALVREPEPADRAPYGGLIGNQLPVAAPPADARALARVELRALAKKAGGVKAGDAETAAHFAEMVELINHMLDAPPLMPAPSH